MIKFVKANTEDFDRYFVYNGEVLIGSVIKRKHWTVRGDRVRWEARKGGPSLIRGDFSSRQEAADALMK